MDGMGLNITVSSYAGNLDFGITSTHTIAPDIGNLSQHLLDTLFEMKHELLNEVQEIA